MIIFVKQKTIESSYSRTNKVESRLEIIVQYFYFGIPETKIIIQYNYYYSIYEKGE